MSGVRLTRHYLAGMLKKNWGRILFISSESAYLYEDLALNPDGTTSPAPPVGGIKGPAGDNYLYPHLQVDAQMSYRLSLGLEAYAQGLNLTNEVFGFYFGSPQYVVQREYYQPTYGGGLRWTSHQIGRAHV